MTSYRWIICALLFFATTVNYIDRAVLGILKPMLEKDLGWTQIEYGWIVTWGPMANGDTGAPITLDQAEASDAAIRAVLPR